jgi:putative tryptophan/tyrosine transport system substrate-binding protein
MRRREFITLLGGTTSFVFVVPLVGYAAGGRPRIGVLDINSAEYSVPLLTAFRAGLQQLGYTEGRTVDIDYRYSDGDTNGLAALAQELVQLKPDVVLATAVSPTRAVKRVAPSLPIVCPTFGDAFVPSLAMSFSKPSGSVTGIASAVEGMFGKLTELTLDAIPGATKIGFLANPAGASMSHNEQQVEAAANKRGVEVRIEEVRELDDFDGAFQRLGAEKVQAVIVPGNGLLHAGQGRIIKLATALRLPLVFNQSQDVVAGGFVSYGISMSQNFRRSAIYIDKILKGTPPGDLPIEFPTTFELVINLKIAKALGLTVPPALLSRADEVIE